LLGGELRRDLSAGSAPLDGDLDETFAVTFRQFLFGLPALGAKLPSR
jgi:hypothetical protein